MDYVPRLIDPLIDELLTELPALLLVGPRAVGKTTTARRVGASLLRLDRPADAAAARLDPDALLAGEREPVVIDEWPRVPEILGAVKRAVDDRGHAAMFLLTGSAGTELGADGWPATGRVVRLPMWGFTVAERLSSGAGALPAPFLDRVRGAHLDAVRPRGRQPDPRAYIDHALTGGFPEVVSLSTPERRRRWLASWIDQVVARDVPLVGASRDPVRLRRYLTALAAQTAGLPQDQTLYEAAGINRVTASAYDTVLETVFVTERIPAWASNRLDRLVRTAKRHLVEPALVGPLLGVDSRAVLRDPDLLGRLLDSFVVAQLRPELTVASGEPRLFHLRSANGRREVDLIAERADGSVVGIEVKATTSPSRDDARHLLWLRDALGERFDAGVVLHAGTAVARLDDRILALPISALWSGAEAQPS